MLNFRPTHRCDVRRRKRTGTHPDSREPIYERVTVAESVPCRFQPQQTRYVRSETGERTIEPAQAVLGPDATVEASDRLVIAGEGTFEVRGISTSVDGIRGGMPVEIVCELQEVTG